MCSKWSICLNSVRIWAPEHCIPICKATCLLTLSFLIPHSPILLTLPNISEAAPIYWRQLQEDTGRDKNSEIQCQSHQGDPSTCYIHTKNIKCKGHSAKKRYQELYVVMKKSPEEFRPNKTIQPLDPEASLLPYFKWFTGKVILVKKVYYHSIRLNEGMDVPIKNPSRSWASSTSGFYPDSGNFFLLVLHALFQFCHLGCCKKAMMVFKQLAH